MLLAGADNARGFAGRCPGIALVGDHISLFPIAPVAEGFWAPLVQALRNFFFYFSPLLGALAGGLIGLSYNAFFWVFEVLIGFGAGCVVSVCMIALSVRARFKADPSLTRNALEKTAAKTRSTD